MFKFPDGKISQREFGFANQNKRIKQNIWIDILKSKTNKDTTRKHQSQLNILCCTQALKLFISFLATHAVTILKYFHYISLVWVIGGLGNFLYRISFIPNALLITSSEQQIIFVSNLNSFFEAIIFRTVVRPTVI